jgi:glutaconate CoA-transferase subunit A
MIEIITMKEAIRKFVNDGDIAVISCNPEGAAASACHEIIRQKKRDLTYVSSGGYLIDMMVGAGCIKRLISSYIGAEVFGRLYCVERALKEHIPHRLEIEDYSHYTLTLRLMAASWGMPFLPTKSILGTDILRYLGDKVKVIEDPFKGGKVLLVPPLHADVGIFHTQCADEEGNVLSWGTGSPSIGGFTPYACCKKVIVSVEEIVSSEITRRNPYLTAIPAFYVNALVVEPWGAHPEALTGYYDMDVDMKLLYGQLSRTIEGFKKFMDEWVYGVENRAEYINHYIRKYGYEKLMKLRPKTALSYPINLGMYVGYP